ncbi:apolipoprotein N-acyltransferase [Rhodocytophaga aerolata]|uniref:Apolipoprotein N-acyltransferase n=1 Tax=Rhodocytophaga aerolata TaxID=455078 RepID=A0ABT8R4P2_9BACT|nr:apolipoprotein N-acyltransferase [Rhodocytophaga aerolata]MDO1446666.1 apolipoprotein N-acyltransferase [Rhodocytophaga aerolata]
MKSLSWSKVRNSRYYFLWLSVLSGVLLSTGWMAKPMAFFLLFAFVPLLRLESHLVKKNVPKPGRTFFLYAYITLLVWNILTTWWVYNSTAIGGIFAMLANAFLQTIPLILFRFTKARSNEKFGYISLVFYWIVFEFIHLNWDLSWPWLTLGNGFLYTPEWVQWYEFTGVLGGTLWIWLANFTVYFALVKHKGVYTKTARLGGDIYALLVMLFPIVYSYYLYETYVEKGKEVEFVVVQPNIDPFSEKFVGTENFIPFEQQVERFISLSESQITPKTRFVLWPETAIDGLYQEATLEQEPILQQIKTFVQKHPQLSLLTGITSYTIYENKKAATPTARFRKDVGYYDVFNTAVFLEGNKPAQLYHKSKLVPGVELMPYPAVFGFLTDLIFNLGGTSGGYGKQEERTVFANNDGIGLAPAICYESVYGDFMTNYIRNGADFIAIITNDGWWGNTPGHKQHLAYASLRAIETRRSIARSANTGISGFINQRGDILYPTEYWVPDVVNATIRSNQTITFYVKNGDYLGRIASFIAPLLLLSVLVKARIAFQKKRAVAG